MSLEAVRRLPWDGDTAARRRARRAHRGAVAVLLVPRAIWAGAILTPIAGVAAAVASTVAANREPQEAAITAVWSLLSIAPYFAVARAIRKLMR